MEGEHKRRRYGYFALAALLLIGLYPLSVGPVAWLLEKTNADEAEWVNTTTSAIYVPLDSVVTYSHTEELMSDYVALFVDPFAGATYTHVEANSYDVHLADIAAKGKEEFLSRLKTWLGAHGYVEANTEEEIKQITSSSSKQDFALVFKKPLDPSAPESFFALTCYDMPPSRPVAFIVNVSAARTGKTEDHDRQIPLIEPEFRAIETAFPELKPHP